MAMSTKNLAGDDDKKVAGSVKESRDDKKVTEPRHPRESGAKDDAKPTRDASETAAIVKNAPVEHEGESDDPAALNARVTREVPEYDEEHYDYHELSVSVDDGGFGTAILEGVSQNAIHNPHLAEGSGAARVEISAANGDVDTRFAVTGGSGSATVRYYLPKN